MAKKQHYMTEAERYKLEAYREAGKGVSWIARTMGCCRQTIYNELRRGAYVHTCEWWDEVRYSADKGQQVHEYNQTAKGRPVKLGKDYAYARFLEEKILGVQENGKVERKKRVLSSGGPGTGQAGGFPDDNMREHPIRVHRGRGIPAYQQQRPLGEVQEKDPGLQSGKKAGASEAAQHRGETGAYQQPGGAWTHGSGPGSEPIREEGRSADRNGTGRAV